MNTDMVKGIFYSIIILLTQVMVLNNIHLFGYATPFLLVYIIVSMPVNMPRWLSLLLGFVIGILSDTFSNTPGMAAIPMTLLALIQPPLAKKLCSEEYDEMWPSLHTMNFGKYLTLTSILVFVFCLIFYTLEQFTFFSIQQWLCYIGGSTLLTLLLIFAIESLRRR